MHDKCNVIREGTVTDKVTIMCLQTMLLGK